MCSETVTDVCSNFLTPSASPGASRCRRPAWASRARPAGLCVRACSEGQAAAGPRHSWGAGSGEGVPAGLVHSLLLHERQEEPSVHTQSPVPRAQSVSISWAGGGQNRDTSTLFLPGLPGSVKLPEGLALLGSTLASGSSAGLDEGQGQLASPAGTSQSLVRVPWTGPGPSREHAF